MKLTSQIRWICKDDKYNDILSDCSWKWFWKVEKWFLIVMLLWRDVFPLYFNGFFLMFNNWKIRFLFKMNIDLIKHLLAFSTNVRNILQIWSCFLKFFISSVWIIFYKSSYYHRSALSSDRMITSSWNRVKPSFVRSSFSLT